MAGRQVFPTLKKRTKLLAYCVLLTAAFPIGALAAELAPLEAYGNLPSISAMALSPSGNRIAYRQTSDDTDIVVVQDVNTSEIIGGTNVARVKPRYVYFADEDRIILVASQTTRREFLRRQYENSAAYVLDVKTSRIRQLLTHADNLYPAQSGLGLVVGQREDRKTVYMPAFTGSQYDRPRYSLFEVRLDRKIEKSIALGTRDTLDWFVDADGRPLIEIAFDNRKNFHRIWARGEGNRRLLYEEETDRPMKYMVGLTPERDALVFGAIDGESDFAAYYQLSVQDGAVDGPLFARDDAGVEQPLTDLNRIVYGVQYSGFLPTYEFADSELNARVERIQSSLGSTAAYLIDWTPDFDTLLFRVSGGWNSGAYVLASRDSPKPRMIAYERPEIPSELVVPTAIFEYQARDGVTIPALLTIRQDVQAKGNAPLIVLPHGGPAAYDRFEFDWLAQFLASRGNAVLQPQYRGSTGFGFKLTELGRGEWGGKMSTDLDDGVKKLIDDGIADPARVGIVGASYGGYAALAAGAFSSFDYRCIVSIAGVSDLPRMLREQRRMFGRDHWVLAYWQDQLASADPERFAPDVISPVNKAEAFRAPVLLIHGKKDTIVPIEQSAVMQKALKRANKEVTLVRLDGEDHFLSKGETRLETLKHIAQFVDRHL